MLIKRRRTIFFTSVLLLTLFVGQSYASLTTAPVNPAYKEYIESQKVNTARKASRGGSRSSSGETRFMGLMPTVFDSSHIRVLSNPIRNLKSKASKSLPSKYDLRTEEKVTEVKDQGDYGTCWSFATMASIESSLIANGLKSVDVSERHLAWFGFTDESPDKPSFTKHELPADYDPIYSQGGNSSQSTALLARWTGPVNEADCRYSEIGVDTVASGILPVAQLRNVYTLSNKDTSMNIDNSDIKRAVMSGHALYVGFCWFNDCYDKDTYAYYCPDKSEENGHAVTIVGWDDNFTKEKFELNLSKGITRPTENGAWLVKNSWGTEWGSDGYFWISYEDVNLQDFTQFEVATSDLYDKQYFYDPLGMVNSAKLKTSSIYTAAIFEASGDPAMGKHELIKAVAFYATDSGLAYNIEIHTGVIEGQPSSGTKVASQTGKFDHAGYHTIALDSDVVVRNGKKFSVMIKVDSNKGYKHLIPMEYYVAEYSEAASANSGETFYSLDGTEWNDIYNEDPTANICIKAFTSNVDAPNGGCSTGFVPILFLMGTVIITVKKKKK